MRHNNNNIKLSSSTLSCIILLASSCLLSLILFSTSSSAATSATTSSKSKWRTPEELAQIEWPDDWAQFKDWATGRKTGTIHEGGRKRQLTAADANCTITFAGTVSLNTSGATYFYSTLSNNLVDGYRLFQEWSNSMPPVLVDGQLCNFTMRWLDDHANRSEAVELYKELMADPTVDVLVGPVTGAISMPVRVETERQGRMLVGSIVADTIFYFNQPHSYMVTTPDKYNFPAVLQLLALQGAKTVAWIKEAGSTFFPTACDSIPDSALDAGITAVPGGSLGVPSTNDAARDGYAQNISITTATLQALDPDIVIYCANPPTVQAVLTEMRSINYYPRAFFGATFDIVQYQSVPDDLKQYLGGVSQWTTLANKPGDPFFGTPAEYAIKFEDTFGYAPNLYTAVGTVVPFLLQLAVERAGTRDKAAIEQAFSLTNMETYWSRIAFDAQGGTTLRDMDGLQYGKHMEMLMVAPSRYATDLVIYPAPNWDDRVYDPQYFAHESEIVMAVLSGVLILSSIALMVFTVVFWKHVVIAAASPLFLLFFLAGSMIGYASVFMWMLHTNGTMCILTFWFLAIGFGLMFGSLFAKTWRIQKIIGETKKLQGGKSWTTKVLIFLRIKNPNKKRNKKNANRFKKSEVITWKRLVVILAIIVGIEILILTVYTIIAPFFDLTEKVVKSEYYETQNYTQCVHNAVFITFAVLLAAYNLGLMIYGVLLSWMLRNVQWTLFNESKAIAFAMYNMFFFSVLISALEFSGAVSRETMFILRSLGIFAAAAISVSVIFAPKIYFICRGINTLDGSTSHSKDSKLSITDAEEIKAEEDRVKRGLEPKPEDDPETLRMKALLRQVHTKMQDGTIPLKWADLEASADGRDPEDSELEMSSSTDSNSSDDPENDAGVP